MRKNVRTLINSLFSIALISFPAFPQTPVVNSSSRNIPANNMQANNANYILKRGTNEYGVWGGVSFSSPSLIGQSKDRKLVIIGLRYGRIFATSKRISYEYIADVIPLALIFQPKSISLINGNTSSPVYGAGFSPIGFKINFNQKNRAKPFVNLSGGFLYFREPVPVNIPDATRFNFTFEAGGGIQIITQARRAIILGYKFHHISNANISRINPGLDANLFYLGFSIYK